MPAWFFSIYFLIKPKVSTLNVRKINYCLYSHSEQKVRINYAHVIRDECTNLGTENNQIKFDYK